MRQHFASKSAKSHPVGSFPNPVIWTMCHWYTHFVHIHYDTILPMPPGRDLLSLPLTATSGTAKLQAGPIGSMQGFDRQLLLNTRQSVGWTLRRPVRLHGRYPGSLGVDPDEAQAATTTLRIYCYRLHINQLRLFQYWTRLGRCREGVMNDVLCGSIWLILVRAFWEYFTFLAIAKVGTFPDPTHRATKCYIVPSQLRVLPVRKRDDHDQHRLRPGKPHPPYDRGRGHRTNQPSRNRDDRLNKSRMRH